MYSATASTSKLELGKRTEDSRQEKIVFGTQPVHMKCPKCTVHIVTEVTCHNDSNTCLSVCCCCIQCIGMLAMLDSDSDNSSCGSCHSCDGDKKVYEHKCPLCKKKIGTYVESQSAPISTTNQKANQLH